MERKIEKNSRGGEWRDINVQTTKEKGREKVSAYRIWLRTLGDVYRTSGRPTRAFSKHSCSLNVCLLGMAICPEIDCKFKF